MCKWISIKDRLPEEGVSVLAVVFDEIDLGHFEVIDKECYHWFGSKYSYIDKAYRCITHWAKEPDLPKK